jgi:hypothetical protein
MEEILVSALGKLIVPLNSLWQITSIDVDHQLQEVYVCATFTQDFYKVKGKKIKLYDSRPARQWRHLDLWQYKTFITASVPRYKTVLGVYLYLGQTQMKELPYYSKKNFRNTSKSKKSN